MSEIQEQNRQSVVDKILAIIADKSDRNVSEIKLSDDLSDDLGFDSLDAVELCMEVEQSLKITFTDEEMETFTTVQDVVNMVEKKLAK